MKEAERLCLHGFKDEALATQLQSKLNRLKFVGKVLTVERAIRVNFKSMDRQHECQMRDLPNASQTKESSDYSFYPDFGLKKFVLMWHCHISNFGLNTRIESEFTPPTLNK